MALSRSGVRLPYSPPLRSQVRNRLARFAEHRTSRNTGPAARDLPAARGALAATKALVARARLHAPASLVHQAAEAFSAAALGAEGQEGTMAFLQKRNASWVPSA